MTAPNLLSTFQEQYVTSKAEVFGLQEYLEIAQNDPMSYAFPAERMIKSIGEPELINTNTDPRLSRLFGNRVLKRYSKFADFFGIEEVIENIINYFRHNAQGLEEARQLLYLLGPVGSAKSSLVERIKELMEEFPIYVLAVDQRDGTVQRSPYLCRPMSLFSSPKLSKILENDYKINPRYAKGLIGPWEAKRLREFDGDITKFRVMRVMPSRLNQLAICNTEPGDPNTQDVSTLTGKVDIRMLETHSQSDPDAYSFSAGLNLSNQGILDFREMFKASIKMLNPLLFAVQEHAYNGTEPFGPIPYDGMVVAHSNEAEWFKFRNNKDNEAFLDRICIVKVPYTLRIDEEVNIYEKFVAQSELANAPVAPYTLQMLAQFAVLTRLNEPQNADIFSKLRTYNGENLKNTDPHAKTFIEYRDDPDNRVEGFLGISTRWASKRISQTFNADAEELAANPVHLMKVLNDEVERSDFGEDTEKKYKHYLSTYMKKKYIEYLDKEIRTAYLESYGEYGQNLFDRYILWASHWVEDNDYFDSSTGQSLNKNDLDTELQKVEKAANIANPKDFRNEVVRYCLKHQAQNQGTNPEWRSYNKLKEVIEKRMFSNLTDIMPVISFTPKGSDEDQKKHHDFIERMMERGYTKKQVRLLVDWYQKTQSN